MAASICGKPGDPGNAFGVGKYCVTIDDCAASTKATICSTIGNPGAYFCTAQCDPCGDQTFCGSGAACVCADLGCGCTPNECIARLVDGGMQDAGCSAMAMVFHASLNGAQETPATTSTATGNGTFILKSDGTTVTYRVTNNVTNVTAAHIHKGAIGMSGVPVFPLTPAGNTMTGTLTFSAQNVADLKAGGLYVNVHSGTDQNGEIRGQIVAPQH
jgi:hypothetical protein